MRELTKPILLLSLSYRFYVNHEMTHVRDEILSLGARALTKRLLFEVTRLSSANLTYSSLLPLTDNDD